MPNFNRNYLANNIFVFSGTQIDIPREPEDI